MNRKLKDFKKKFSRMIEKFKIIKETIQENLNFYDESDIDADTVLVEEDENKLDIFDVDLESICDLMNCYVGLMIVNISGRKNNIQDISEKTQTKIISSIQAHNKSIEFNLLDLKGQNAGKLIFIFSVFGMFADKKNTDDIEVNSIYRVSFYGGDCLEYLDSKGFGNLIYET